MANAKAQLTALLQQFKGGLLAPTDVEYSSTEYGAQWQTVLTLGIADGQQFAGELAASQAQAEEFAALQAIQFVQQRLSGGGTAAVAAPAGSGVQTVMNILSGSGGGQAELMAALATLSPTERPMVEQLMMGKGCGAMLGGGMQTAASAPGTAKGQKQTTWGVEKEKKKSARQNTPCSFFVKGQCNYGNECGFSHDPSICMQAISEGKETSVCRLFLAGNCQRGLDCPFRHEGPGDTAKVAIADATIPGAVVEPASDHIHVRGLPLNASIDSIRQDFSTLSNATLVSIKVLDSTGETCKAALLRFASEAEAKHVKDFLNGVQPEGFESPLEIKYEIVNTTPPAASAAPAEWPAPAVWPAGDGMLRPGAKSWGKGGGKEDRFESSENLYIKGMPLTSTVDSIKQDFAAFGTVQSVKVLELRPGDTCKAAMVRFTNQEEAKYVKESLDTVQPEGFPEPLMVKYAALPGANSLDGGKGKGKPEDAPCDNLWVKGLPLTATQDSVREDFSALQVTVVSVRVLASRETDTCGAALVRFSSEQEAMYVKETLNGQQPDGFPEPLQVRFSECKKGKGDGKDDSWGKAADGAWGKGGWGKADGSWGGKGKDDFGFKGGKDKGFGKGKGKYENGKGGKGGGYLLQRNRITGDKIFGVVDAWKGKYGWIKPSEQIQHPKAFKHNGALFASVDDIGGLYGLNVGDQVKLHVFEDADGLGAEEVEVLADAWPSGNSW